MKKISTKKAIEMLKNDKEVYYKWKIADNDFTYDLITPVFNEDDLIDDLEDEDHRSLKQMLSIEEIIKLEFYIDDDNVIECLEYQERDEYLNG